MRPPKFFLQADVDNVGARLHILLDGVRHAGREDDDERRILAHRCRLLRGHFTHRDPMLLENLREGSSAVTRWVANADSDSVHTSVRQRGKPE